MCPLSRAVGPWAARRRRGVLEARTKGPAMLVRDVMTIPAVTIRPDATVKAAIAALDEHQITAMPVVDEHSHLVGVVSEADVLRESLLPDRRSRQIPDRMTGSPASLRVSDVMSHLPVSVTPDEDLANAVSLLVETQIKSLPVVDHEGVVGMISRRDVIAVLARHDQLIEAEVDELLREADVECEAVVAEGVVHLTGPTEPSVREIARVLAASIPGVVAVTFDA
jgi:CBS domain-containing protein